MVIVTFLDDDEENCDISEVQNLQQNEENPQKRVMFAELNQFKTQYYNLSVASVDIFVGSFWALYKRIYGERQKITDCLEVIRRKKLLITTPNFILILRLIHELYQHRETLQIDLLDEKDLNDIEKNLNSLINGIRQIYNLFDDINFEISLYQNWYRHETSDEPVEMKIENLDEKVEKAFDILNEATKVVMKINVRRFMTMQPYWLGPM